MANTVIGTRSPNGSVGVLGWLDNADLKVYRQGVLEGFAYASETSLTKGTAVAENNTGERDLLACTNNLTAISFPGAPTTASRQRWDAVVAFKNPAITANVSNGVNTIDVQVVSGAEAVIGSAVMPSMANIRSAITNGSVAFVAVLGYMDRRTGVAISAGYWNRNLSEMSICPVPVGTELVVPTGINLANVYLGTAWVDSDYIQSEFIRVTRSIPVGSTTIAGVTWQNTYASAPAITSSVSSTNDLNLYFATHTGINNSNRSFTIGLRSTAASAASLPVSHVITGVSATHKISRRTA